LPETRFILVSIPAAIPIMLIHSAILALQRVTIDDVVPQEVMAAWERPLFSIGKTPVTVATLVVFVLILVATRVASILIQRATTRALSRRAKADLATLAITTRLVNYAVLFIGLTIALQTVGISVTGLFAAGAFFAVALGFAMQNIAENFVAGIILMTERTIKPGDVLKVEDVVVRVTRLGLRTTIVRSRDEEDLIVPNSVLAQSTLTNYTLHDAIFRIRATVGVSYDSDVRLVMEVLKNAAAGLPDPIDGYEPVVLFIGFGDSSINFEVSAWVSQPWTSRRTLSALNQSIWWALKEHNISIPFPQRDVRLITPPPAQQELGR
jgi:small-conductance mechanosensitive channel